MLYIIYLWVPIYSKMISEYSYDAWGLKYDTEKQLQFLEKLKLAQNLHSNKNGSVRPGYFLSFS